jgi:carotenoid 1,2-hydratase
MWTNDDTEKYFAPQPAGFCKTLPCQLWRTLWKGLSRMVGNISKTESPNKNTRPLPRGRKHAPGAGRADGSFIGDAGGGSFAARPRFDVAVAPNGYRWWYIDALSDDGQNGLTIIGFVGSVFSPYYARARKIGVTAAENHCALNVALYGTKRRWTMTERGAKHTNGTCEKFTVGPSAMTWDDEELVIDINERCTPLPRALRGKVKLTALHTYESAVMLDADGKHFWQAVAPQARVSVEFENPKLSWVGSAYHDMNWGDEPLERGFKNWTWLRANTPSGTHVLYDVERRDGSRLSFGRRYQSGQVGERDVPPKYELQKGIWGMTRSVSSEETPRLIAKLEDAPFYTRNHIAMTLDGAPCEAFHESLSLDRFINPVVQLMLPFRMPRRA